MSLPEGARELGGTGHGEDYMEFAAAGAYRFLLQTTKLPHR